MQHVDGYVEFVRYHSLDYLLLISYASIAPRGLFQDGMSNLKPSRIAPSIIVFKPCVPLDIVGYQKRVLW